MSDIVQNRWVKFVFRMGFAAYLGFLIYREMVKATANEMLVLGLAAMIVVLLFGDVADLLKLVVGMRQRNAVMPVSVPSADELPVIGAPKKRVKR